MDDSCHRYRLDVVRNLSAQGLVPGVDVNVTELEQEDCLDGWSYSKDIYQSTLVSEVQTFHYLSVSIAVFSQHQYTDHLYLDQVFQVDIEKFLLFQIQLFECLCMHKYSSLTWCAVSSGSNHSHPLFSSWEFFLDPSFQDRLQTGDKNTFSQTGRDWRLFCDFFENGYFDWSQGRCGFISICCD